jgi:VanZ family protein
MQTFQHRGSAMRTRPAKRCARQASRVWLRQTLWYWLPPLLWITVIFWLSTDTFSAEHTEGLLRGALQGPVSRLPYAPLGLIHFAVRKAAHLIEYAILTMLLLRAVHANATDLWHWRWASAVWLLVAAHAMFDEYHQSFTQYRTASIWDSLLDMAGGLVALLLVWRSKYQPALPPACRVLMRLLRLVMGRAAPTSLHSPATAHPSCCLTQQLGCLTQGHAYNTCKSTGCEFYKSFQPLGVVGENRCMSLM